MTVQRLLDGKGTFVPVISYDATLRDAIAQLEIDNVGALMVTDDKRRILGLLSARSNYPAAASCTRLPPERARVVW